jgi:transposase-like protein
MTRTPHSHHSSEFKEQALLKARHRGTRSVISISSELNMSAGTLRKWLQSAKKKADSIAYPARRCGCGLNLLLFVGCG